MFQPGAFPSPSPDLAPYVERYWVVSWSYSEPYRQLIVPYPNLHLTFQNRGATVHGVSSARQIKVLDGINGVFGMAFRPACFRPFRRAPVSTITNRSIDAGDVFDGALPDPVDVATVEGFLRAQRPESDAKAQRAADIVAKIAAHPTVTSVDTLAHDLDTSVRGLQR